MFARVSVAMVAAAAISIGLLTGAAAATPEAGETGKLSKGKGNKGLKTGKNGRIVVPRRMSFAVTTDLQVAPDLRQFFTFDGTVRLKKAKIKQLPILGGVVAGKKVIKAATKRAEVKCASEIQSTPVAVKVAAAGTFPGAGLSFTATPNDPRKPVDTAYRFLGEQQLGFPPSGAEVVASQPAKKASKKPTKVKKKWLWRFACPKVSATRHLP